MELSFVIGVIAGLITVAVVITLVQKFTGTNYFEKDCFDERQLLIRGNAYRYAFFTDLCLTALWVGATEFIHSLPVKTDLALFIIMMISIDVYAIYSILQDAYFGINIDKKRYFIFFVVIVILNLIGGVFNIIGNEISVPLGLGECANLTVVVAFIPLLIAMCMKQGEDKEESDDEES